MMRVLAKILVIFLFSQNIFAQNYKIDDGFYTGFDPTKIDESKFEIDASKNKEEIPVEGKLYGYKFGGGGFFIAPEAMRQLGFQNKNLNLDNSSNQNLQSIDYSLKANIGYEFNDKFSSFISYNLGDISLNPAARNAKLTQNSNSLGVGSQIKLADDFIVRVTYSQQQVDDFTNSQNRLQSDIIRFGTSINF